MFMEMTNNDSRFNLISFCSGGARRHPPLRSVFTLLFCICFSLFSSPLSAFATAPIITPEFQPVIDTDVVSLQEQYLNLNPVAQAAGSIIFGAYVTEYAGLADYGTVFDSMPTDGTVWDRLQFVGQQAFDTLMLPVNMANQLVVRPLYNLMAGIANSVQNVSDLDDFKSDVMNSDKYALPYNPDIGNSLNQLFAENGGLYNWQVDHVTLTPDAFTFDYNTYTLTQNAETNYVNALNSGSSPKVRFNSNNWPNYKNRRACGGFFNQYNNLFINTNSNRLFFVNDSGVAYPGTGWKYNYYLYATSETSVSSGWTDSNYSLSNNNGWDVSSYSDVLQIVKAINNGTLRLWNDGNVFALSDFVHGLYIGNSWDNRQPWVTDTDLGFTEPYNLQYLNPKQDAVFDLKGLVNDIVAAPEHPNETIPLKDIALQNLFIDNDQVQAQQLQPTSVNVTPSSSGVTIPEGLFSGLLDTGGFVSYLWYMTKPLVSFTGDLIDAFTFDGFDGADPVTGATVHFSGSGPGQIFIGVVCVGLIGGLVVKCLL